MRAEDVVIIGAGPAGMATALQLRRYGIEPLLLEKNHTGGLLLNAHLVENYPGFPEGIGGPQLVQLFEAQLERARQKVTCEEVLELDYVNNFTVKTSLRLLHSRFVVIASGTRPKKVSFSGEAPDRVLYEITSIVGVAGQKIVIVGAGDAAFDYALNLSRQNEVTILNKSQKVKCLPLLQKRARESARIEYRESTTVDSVRSAGNGLVLSCRSPEGQWELGADYAIFAIGRMPELGYIAPSLKDRAPALEESRLLYRVGDVKNDIYRQTSIAVGDGVRAAMMIYRRLKGID